MKAQIRPLCALPALVVLTSASAPTAPLPGPLNGAAAQDDSAVYIDPRADRILFAMGEYLGGAPAFEMHAETVKDEPHPSGQWVQVSRASDISLHRERGLRASVTGDLDNREFWTDLETAAMLDPDSATYALVQVPATLDGAIDHLLEEYGVAWPLADLAYSDPYLGLIEGVQVGTYVGLHKTEGIPCHHLAFQQATIDWQIWIDAGQRPVPRKVIVTYKRIDGAPRIVARLSKWNFSPYLPESFFDFVAPEGAQQIELETLEGN